MGHALVLKPYAELAYTGKGSILTDAGGRSTINDKAPKWLMESKTLV